MIYFRQIFNFISQLLINFELIISPIQFLKTHSIILNLIINFLTAFGTIGTTIIAFYGLYTWKQQLKGNYVLNLTTRSLRQLNEVKVAYLNISEMWQFIPINNELIIFRMPDYSTYVNNMSVKITELETSLVEMTTTWPDFPKKNMEIFLKDCKIFRSQANSFINEQKGKNFTIRLDNSVQYYSYIFFAICSDSLFIYDNDLVKKISSFSSFQKNNRNIDFNFKIIVKFLQKKIELG